MPRLDVTGRLCVEPLMSWYLFLNSVSKALDAGWRELQSPRETRRTQVSPTHGRTSRTHCVVKGWIDRGWRKTPKTFRVDRRPVDARVVWDS